MDNTPDRKNSNSTNNNNNNTNNNSSSNSTLSKFEDSPLFKYINSLSPIPVKSVHVTQTFNSLTFSSPPSVFTSPHVNCHKESRFLRRHNLLDTSKANASSEDANQIQSGEEAHTVSTHASELAENADQGISAGDALIKPSSEHTKFSIELPQALKYDSGSPGYDALLCGDEALLELPSAAASNVVYIQDGSRKDTVETELHLQGICQGEPRIDGPDCDWDNLMADASDLLVLSSPNVAEAFKGLVNKQLDPSMRPSNFVTLLPQSTTNNGHMMHIVNPVASGSAHDNEDHPPEPLAASDTDHTQDNLANVALVDGNPSAKMDDEHVYVIHRGIRRRCLDFEMANVIVRRSNSNDNPNTGSIVAKSDERNIGNEKQVLPIKHSGDSQRCFRPGIGLHLNAIATLKDHGSITGEKLSTGGQPNLLSSTSSLLPLSSQEHHLPLVPVSSERDFDPSENDVQIEDGSQSSAYMAGEDFHQNSPKKKRRKMETAGESESCKRCNCKKSKCLKLYCECFAAGVYCIDSCSCQGCLNKPIYEDTVLQTRKQIESRNPLAFAPKVIRSSETAPEIGDDPNKTPASARHKRGCNCKKSSCLKKYCECYQGGVGCSISCRCEGCKNTYGRKDGSAPTGIEAEAEEEPEACEKGVVEKASQKTEIQNIEDNPDSALPKTPLRLSRPLLPLPFSSKGKPPRSFVATISASGIHASQKLGKLNALRPQAANFEKAPQSAADDEMMDVIRGDSSPITCIKTSSPNGKRISSPKCDFGSSPTRRGGRKLILQSIPSFPSLNHH